jgi:hypothetical protein
MLDTRQVDPDRFGDHGDLDEGVGVVLHGLFVDPVACVGEGAVGEVGPAPDTVTGI